MNRLQQGLTLSLLALLAACNRAAPVAEDADAAGFSAPTAITAAANARVAESLPLNDPQDFEDARRGLIATPKNLRITSAEGAVIWDQTAYQFIEGPAPASVNPSLWRQAQLNGIHGLFKVADGLYQLRGFDISNMSLIEGKTGWIVVDPLTTKETAAAAWAFAKQHLGDKPVSAFIFTHSHVDHFGGVLGLVSAEEVKARGIRIVAPQGFEEEASSENILAGTTMSRRSTYMYGARLPRSERGHVDTGLGKTVPYGSFGLLPPTELISRTPQELELDGVRIVFQNTPAAEAPAELTFYLPQQKAWCGAEVVTRNLHNVYTLRGAKVRDALRWSGYIDEALRLFGETEIYFASHHWPMWGRERVADFLRKQRDGYKYIHDQTVRLAAQGFTPREIAEQIALPEPLARSFPNRGYYGTVSHNAKAVYQNYFGWYDGNPANLNPLPPEQAGKGYVELAGGAAALKQKARAAYERGEYRWAAELLNHLVFAEPGDAEARELLARCYDQLGYQSESGPWRDVYLSGAFELRHGAPDKGPNLASAMEMLRQAPLPRFFDAMAGRLDGAAAAGKDYKVKLVFSDLQQIYLLSIENSVLHHRPATADEAADATLELTHEIFLRMTTGTAGLSDTLMSDDLKVSGSRLDLIRFFSLIERPEGRFNIVTP